MKPVINCIHFVVFLFCCFQQLPAQRVVPLKKEPEQLSNDEIEQINKFNRLFGDYFYVNQHMEILPLKDTLYSFSDFYREVRINNWSTNFENNLDENPVLMNPYSNVITMNLKFEEEGFFPELPFPKQQKRDEPKLQSSGVFMSDTIQKINTYYRTPVTENQNKDSITRRTDAVISGKIAETLKSIAYVKKYDENGYNLKNFALDVLNKIDKYQIRHIYFFAHGYNVPYSLAQIQGNRLLKQIYRQHPNENILFIRIFWKGGEAKKLNVKTRNVNGHLMLKKIQYKDKISIKNATGFKKKAKEAIKCGYSLRRLLHLLELGDGATDKRTFHLFSHSMGAVMLSHSLMNDISYIRYKPTELVKITKQARYVLDSSWMYRADSLMNAATCKGLKKVFCSCSKERNEALEYISFMRYTRLPELNVRIFMNAPAIPGVQLFQFADVCKSYNFMVGYNLYDPTLAKRFAGKKTLISGKLSHAAGNTSLGLNYNNEVGQTEFLINRNLLKSPNFCFKGYRTSNFFEHDLFFYMQHPLFINAMKIFTEPLK